MKFKSSVFTQVSGSVGGLTYSHNQGGMYTRARAIPVNPASAAQQVVRNLVSQLTNLWSNTLTEAERAAWDVYAANVPVVNKLGDQILLSGLNWYVKCNVPRRQAGLARIDAAPVTFTLDTLTPPSFTLDAANDEADVVFTNTDDWANEVGGALLTWFSLPHSVGTTFFKGPFRTAPEVPGAGTPPTSPQAIALPFAVATGNKVFGRFQSVRADGRVSPIFTTSATALFALALMAWSLLSAGGIA